MLALIRHGETASNIAGRFQGQSDEGLHDQGRRRFQGLALTMSRSATSSIFCSAQRRAIESASIISHICVLPDLNLDARLGERHLGLLDGKYKKALLTNDPGLEERLFELDFCPEGGEAASICVDRFSSVIERILDERRGHVIAVTHGGVAALYAFHVLGISRDSCFLDHGEAHVLERRRNGGVQVKRTRIPPDELANLFKG